MLRKFAHAFDRAANRRRLAVLIPGVLIVALRLAILPWYPVPDPMAPDEFSQLFAAETFASGRATNPTPAQWIHLETPYVLMHPTYASKYPPGPPLMMALGIALTGFAWAGVLLSGGLMCSGFCWTLQGWLAPRWALAGALLAVGRYSLHHYWINSYWGGCLAAFGGALVLGALPRILRSGGTGPALAMASGFMILLVSRPYEGLLFSVVPGFLVLRWSAQREALKRLTGVTAPMAALITVAAFAFGYYNWRVTGSPVVLPYAAYTAQYEPAPHFILQSRREVAPFLHAEMERYLTFPGVVERQRTLRGMATRLAESVGIPLPLQGPGLRHPKVITNVLFGFALLCSILLVARDRKMRVPLVMLAIIVIGLLPETFFFDHYAAPAAGLMLLIVTQGLRHAAVWKCWRRGFGRSLPFVIAAGALAAVAVYSVVFVRTAVHPPQYITVDRPRVEAHVARYPGKHLILVRFGNAFTIDDGDWIYNKPDVDAARIVWARDMGVERNTDLLEHFNDREVWYVYKNRGPARIYREGTAACEPALGSCGARVMSALR